MNPEKMETIGRVIQSFRQRDNVGIKIAGSGGQGVILAGNILGAASMNANFNASQMQSYDAATRGTSVSSDVIISRKGVLNYPVIKKADLLVTFTQTTFDTLQRKVKPTGIIRADEDLVASTGS